MVADLQLGEAAVVEQIGWISRLPLAKAEQLVGSVGERAQLAVVDLPEFAPVADGASRNCPRVCGDDAAPEVGPANGGRRQSATRENYLNRQLTVRKSGHCRIAAMRVTSSRRPTSAVRTAIGVTRLDQKALVEIDLICYREGGG
jgi:hypothetical protein